MARTVRFRACILLLLTVFLVSPAVAVERKPSEKRNAPGVVSLLWGTLGKFFPALSKSRGSMDPDGSPAPASATTSGNDGDARGSMDPDG